MRQLENLLACGVVRWPRRVGVTVAAQTHVIELVGRETVRVGPRIWVERSLVKPVCCLVRWRDAVDATVRVETEPSANAEGVGSHMRLEGAARTTI